MLKLKEIEEIRIKNKYRDYLKDNIIFEGSPEEVEIIKTRITLDLFDIFVTNIYK